MVNAKENKSTIKRLHYSKCGKLRRWSIRQPICIYVGIRVINVVRNILKDFKDIKLQQYYTVQIYKIKFQKSNKKKSILH